MVETEGGGGEDARAGDDVVRGFAANAQPHQERRHQRRFGFTREDGFEGGGHLALRWTSSVGQKADRVAYGLAHLRPAFLRKFASITLPNCEPIDSGWNWTP